MNRFMKNTARPGRFLPAALTLLLGNALVTVQAAEAEARLVSVAAVEAQQVAPVQWVPANVISRHDAQVASEQDGQIVWVADIGSTLKQGAVLARIDSEDLQLRLAEQQAVLQRLQASASYYEKQMQRLQALINNNSVARTEMDSSERDRAINAASMQQQQILIAQTRLAISKTTITAPFAGVVAQQRVQLGEYVRTGQAVAQLVDMSALDIQVQAPINLAAFVTNNGALSVEYDGKVWTLPVRAKTAAGSIASRSFEMRLDARKLDATPGMAVRVAIPKAQHEQSLMVPRDALVIREQQMYVLKVDSAGVAQRTPVSLGAAAGEKVAVTAALSIGDKVITRGAESTQHGQKVRVASASLASKVTATPARTVLSSR